MTDDAPVRPAGAPSPRPASPLPPDPIEYDSDRARIARAKGLPTPYIPGGRDPDPEPGRREERYYGRLLLAMVIIVIAAGFVLGIALTIATGSTP
jgi:hypothetical protein